MPHSDAERVRPEHEELHALLELILMPGFGDVRIARLLRQAGTARSALSLLPLTRRAARGLSAHRRQERIRQTLEFLANNEDVSVLTFGSSGYPTDLYHLTDPPPLLFLRGDLSLLDRPMIAIVGTRAATDYGVDATRMLAASLADSGAVVISGLAHGIDRVAHEATLAAGGLTAAVIGSGIDIRYPHQHAALQERIAGQGLLLSEFLPGEPALQHHFPQRNRIIAALAKIICVIEAPSRSGALITADHAIDLGKEVMAVPGPIGRRTNEGTNALLRDGASVLLDPQDLLDALKRVPRSAEELRKAALQAEALRHRREANRNRPTCPPAPAGEPPAAGPAFTVWSALTHDPIHADDLAIRVGLSAAETLAALLDLEVSGHARRGAGMLYCR
jgi:DNA processing protein